MEQLEKQLFGRTNVTIDGEGIIRDRNTPIPEAREAVHKRFILEQAKRTKETIEELCMLKNVRELPEDCFSILKVADYIDGGHELRLADATWHISYYNNQDKERIKKVMQRTGCRRFELLKGIDECISDYVRTKQN